MSTKTSIKRIALVAVSALGLGLMTNIAANAASGLGTVSVADKTVYCFSGDTCKALIAVTTTGAGAATAAADEVITLTTTITSQVTGATTVAKTTDVAENGTATASTKVALRAAGAGASLATTASTVLAPSIVSNKLTITPANAAAAGTYNSGQLEFVPNTPGKYVFTVTPATPGTGDTETAGVITVNVVSVGGTIGDGGAVASPYNAVNGVAGSLNYVTLKASGAARTGTAVGTQLVVTGGTILSASAGTVSTDKTSLVIAGVSHATNAGTDSTITIATPAAGTITVKSYTESSAGIYSTTAADTVTITVNAAAQTGTLSVANSTSIIDGVGTLTAGGFNATTDDTVLVSRNAATVSDNTTEEVAIIKVTVKDTLAAAMPDTTTVSAVISGPGSLGIGATPTAALGRAVSATTSSGVVYITVYRDGSAGTGTITISVGTTTVATETVTFYGAVASLVGTAKVLSIAPGATTSGVIEVVAKDAAGNLVPSVTVTGTASSTTALTSVTSASDGDADGDQLFSVGAAATAAGAYTITFTDGTVTSAPVTITVGKTTAKTVTFSTDKDEYAPGELVTITVKAVDSNGNAVADGTRALLSAAATSSVALQGTLPEASPAISGGVKTYTVYAPLIAGDVVIKSTEGAAADNVIAGGTAAAISTTIKVVDPTGGSSAAIDAANEATDAANAATDAANAAAEAADAATAAAQDAQAAVAELATKVASLIAGIKAQITTLTNLVIKIQKKVRA